MLNILYLKFRFQGPCHCSGG